MFSGVPDLSSEVVEVLVHKLGNESILGVIAVHDPQREGGIHVDPPPSKVGPRKSWSGSAPSRSTFGGGCNFEEAAC